jgi:hypothetical protein
LSINGLRQFRPGSKFDADSQFADIEAAAQALMRLAGEEALRRRLGEAANGRFHERFTLAAVRSVFSDPYRSLMVVRGRNGQAGTGVDPDARRPNQG